MFIWALSITSIIWFRMEPMWVQEVPVVVSKVVQTKKGYRQFHAPKHNGIGSSHLSSLYRRIYRQFLASAIEMTWCEREFECLATVRRRDALHCE